MWSSYDEDLNENSFFKTLLNSHNDLIEKASKENLIICIPRQGTVQSLATNQDFILDHILVPGSSSEQYIYTLSGKCLSVKDKIIVNLNSCYPPQSVQVHFEETFYIDGLKYTLWCLDRPLFQDQVNDLPVNSVVLETSQHCSDYLNSEGIPEIFTNLEKLCQEFLQNNTNFGLETLQTQKELVGSLYSNCLKLALKSRKPKTGNAKKCLSSLKLAVETCMQNILGREILQAINTALCDKNASLNRIVRNLTDLQLKDLNLPYEFCDKINKAKLKLNQLNNYVTVLDKINCLRQTFLLLYSGSTNLCITADTLLQILVFLLTKLDINNWYSNLLYLTEFEFSQLNMSSYVCFMLTSLEAAVEFIQSDWEVLLLKISRPGQGNGDGLFKLIESNDLAGLKNSLVTGDPDDQHADNKKNYAESCHPLCRCQNCSKFVHSENGSSKYKVLGDLTNDRGQNLLSFAAQVGNTEITEFLLSLEQAQNFADFPGKLTEQVHEIDLPDYSGKTPLHYACLRGKQDIVLILVNCQADVNARDQNLNTPLHLAVNNGHEHCVKALLYTTGKSLEMNSINKDGNTALHLAVKWGYQEIAKLLLENGALVSICNRKQQSVQDLACDYHTRALIQQHMSSLDTGSVSQVSKMLTDVSPPRMSKLTFALEPNKKLGILLKAIKNNDLPLVCFYLGFSDSNSITSSHFEKCHPLCLCEKCEDFDHIHVENKKSPEKINVNDCDPSYGYTPLHFAAKYGRTEILRILLDSKAGPNSRTFENLYTPLHLACIYQNVKIVKELVKCGDCQIDPKDSEGNTPLYYACMKNDKRIVELLLVNGADCMLKNNAGVTIVAKVEEKQLFGIGALLDVWKKKPVEHDEDLF